MRKLLTLLALCTPAHVAMAQTTMNIYQSNGSVLQIPLSSIDSITYTVGNPGQLATLTTLPIGNIAATSATSGGNITANGGTAVTQRGVVWSTSPNPTTANSQTSDGSGTGSYTSNLTGLAPSTTYYVRAYATNSAGTAYGNQLSYTTTSGGGGGGILNPNLTYGSMTDQDGNTYATIQIGGQEWMAQNLATSIYRNGDIIPTGLSNSQWENTTSGAYGIYNDNPAYGFLYGNLYNWYAVNDPREVCPTGWHVPTDQDWTTLFVTLDPNTDQNAIWQNPSSLLTGGLMKSTVMYDLNGEGQGYWYPPNVSATNLSGFSALPAGYKKISGGHEESYLTTAYWWSSTAVNFTTAYNRAIYSSVGNAYRIVLDKKYGCSIRCVRD